MSSDKNFFWHGILSLNELGAHAFFDVKVKKNVPDAPNMVGLFTSDIPPLPLSPTDTLHVTFLLENNVGLNTVRYRVVESQFTGAELQQQIDASQGAMLLQSALVEKPSEKNDNIQPSKKPLSDIGNILVISSPLTP